MDEHKSGWEAPKDGLIHNCSNFVTFFVWTNPWKLGFFPSSCFATGHYRTMATSRSLLGLLLCALAYMTLEQCFSRCSEQAVEGNETTHTDFAIQISWQIAVKGLAIVKDIPLYRVRYFIQVFEGGGITFVSWWTPMKPWRREIFLSNSSTDSWDLRSRIESCFIWSYLCI